MIDLSDTTIERIDALFPADERAEVEEFLKTECGDNLPFCRNSDKHQMERIRFAVLKLSKGEMKKLVEAIDLAQKDWRDVLMAAGFGEDPEAHKKWRP